MIILWIWWNLEIIIIITIVIVVITSKLLLLLVVVVLIIIIMITVVVVNTSGVIVVKWCRKRQQKKSSSNRYLKSCWKSSASYSLCSLSIILFRTRPTIIHSEITTVTCVTVSLVLNQLCDQRTISRLFWFFFLIIIFFFFRKKQTNSLCAEYLTTLYHG